MNAFTTGSRTGLLICLLLVAGVLIGCSNLVNQPAASTPVATGAGTEATPETTPGTPDAPSGAVTLNVWLPAAFDPSGDQLAASLLQARLEAFSDEQPSVRVDVRLKSASEAGGMLASLLAAQAAAPLALPDLVLLHSSFVPPAVEAGLLLPTGAVLGDDWFSFAIEMASWNGQVYAWPFVGDGLVIAYRPTAITELPATWLDSLALQSTLAFAAGDASGLFPSSQLLSMGADPAAVTREELSDLFVYFAQGQAAAIFPFWLTQFESQAQSWQAFTEGRAPMVVAWSSQVLSDSTGSYAAAPLIVPSGEPYTLTQGWSWAATTPLAERAEIVHALAAFLSDPEFMSQWGAAAGYLPARSSALAAWSPDQRQVLASQIVGNAHNAPNSLAYPDLGPALSEAVVALLKQEITPEEAVALALDQLAGP